jgi:hypothetical protein
MLVLAGVALVLVAAVVIGTRYLTTVPGQSHRGPLAALETKEAATAARLAAHIRAIASRPHNVAHYDELENAARYIEGALITAGYQPAPQIYQRAAK